MKKLLLTLFIFTSAMMFYSCEKDSDINQESIVGSEIKITDSEGKTISVEEINWDLPDAVVIVMQDNNCRTGIIAQYFKSEDQAYKFISSKPELEDAKRKLEFVRQVRVLAEKTGDIEVSDPELFSKEMKELLSGYNLYQERGVGLLFEHSPPGGASYPVTGHPQVSLFSFNRRASSAQGFGLANWLWSRTWFRGSSVYLLLGTAKFIPLEQIGFNNRACSSL